MRVGRAARGLVGDFFGAVAGQPPHLYFMDVFLEQFSSQVPRRDGRKPNVLDLGCGKGRAALDLAREGFSVLAVDRQDRMLVDHDNITFVQAEIVSWLRRLSPNGTFDGIPIRNLL